MPERDGVRVCVMLLTFGLRCCSAETVSQYTVLNAFAEATLLISVLTEFRISVDDIRLAL